MKLDLPTIAAGISILVGVRDLAARKRAAKDGTDDGDPNVVTTAGKPATPQRRAATGRPKRMTSAERARLAAEQRRIAREPADVVVEHGSSSASGSGLPDVVEFTDEQVALFAEQRGTADAACRCFRPRVSAGLRRLLASKGAARILDAQTQGLPVPVGCDVFRLAALRPGLPAAASLVDARLGAGDAVAGSLSLALLPVDDEVPALLIFGPADLLRAAAHDASHFAMIAAPPVMVAPVVATVPVEQVAPAAPTTEPPTVLGNVHDLAREASAPDVDAPAPAPSPAEAAHEAIPKVERQAEQTGDIVTADLRVDPGQVANAAGHVLLASFVKLEGGPKAKVLNGAATPDVVEPKSSPSTEGNAL